MTTYHINRPGDSDIQGPIFEGPLKEMWTAGTLQPGDLICIDNGSDWILASHIMDSIMESSPQPATTPKKTYGEVVAGSTNTVIALLIFFGLGFVGIALFLFAETFMPLLWVGPSRPAGILLLIAAVVIALLVNKKTFRCSCCGNDVGSKSSRLCQSCRAVLLTKKQKARL
jgi:hypothetical protein